MIEYEYDFSPAASLVHPQHLQFFFIFQPMHLLSCPNCHAELSVTPAQAGDYVVCHNCQGQIPIPKLGELRKLPQIAGAQQHASPGPRSVGGTVAFVTLGLIAVLSLLGAGYNTVRWAMIETETTTESHLVEVEMDYARVEPASMILEFEDMEKFSLDMVTPYRYHAIVMEKAKWGWNAVIASGITLACGLGAFVAASLGRNR